MERQYIQHKGFSLIELLVSMAIFTMVVTMAVGTLLVLVDANSRAQNMETVMTNLNFVVENMAREIRVGRSFYCTWDDNRVGPTAIANGSLDSTDTQDCINGARVLSLVEGGSSLTGNSSAVPRIAYRFNVTNRSIERFVSTGSNSDDWVQLTSSDAVITGMYFQVSGSSDTDNIQPTVRLWITGYSGTLGESVSNFALQTTVTQEVIDYNNS